MSGASTKLVPKNPPKSSTGTNVGNVSSGPALPLASPLMGKKKKPFLGMPAPLGYVPGLGRGYVWIYSSIFHAVVSNIFN